MVTFVVDELLARDPALASRAEEEVRAGLGAAIDGTCRIEVERSGGAAIERLRVVLAASDAACEWTVALPAAAGDIRRATEAALTERRSGDDRRHADRQGLDRRTS